jgi:hypothetical protein
MHAVVLKREQKSRINKQELHSPIQQRGMSIPALNKLAYASARSFVPALLKI